jgi:hypothetical protein
MVSVRTYGVTSFLELSFQMLNIFCSELRITKDTELGDNESIKNPEPILPSRRLRKQEKLAQT